MFERKISNTDWAFWSKWVLANFTVSLPLLPVSLAMGEVLIDPLEVIIFACSIGAVVGISHWLAVRGRIPYAGWWILVNVLGYGAGVPTGLALHLIACAWTDRMLPHLELWLSLPTGMLLAGFIMLFQGLIWRREVRGIRWSIATGAIWVIASVTGAFVARWAYTLTSAMNILALRAIIAGAALGITYGGITGIAVVKAWRYALPSRMPPERPFPHL